MGTKEDGLRTTRLAAEPETAEAMAAFLMAWKKRHPKADEPPHSKPLSQEEVEQLKAIGYLE